MKLTQDGKTALLVFAYRMTASAVYGASVTLLLALLMAYGRPSSPHGDLLRLLGWMARTFTPWFMLGYSVSRMILPDVQLITRSESLLLPAVEGGVAVLCVLAWMWLGIDISDPYLHTLWTVVVLVLSVLGARLFVRRVFRF